MKIKHLIFALLTVASASSFTGCNDSTPDPKNTEEQSEDSVYIAPVEEKEDLNEIADLCKYQYPNGDGFLSNPCEGTIFIKRMSGEGIVKYDSLINGYTVFAEGKGDCLIITLLCGDYSNLLGKEINYTCDYYEYNGFFDPPLGGMEVFTGKDIDYSIK